MSSDYDFTLVPLARNAESEAPQLLGLYTADPPRRCARGRAADRLILYLVMTGNAPFTPPKQSQLLENLAKLFYATSGSATSGMRAVAEQLNELLWKRNLRLASSNHHGMGVLTQVVLRESQAYLAVSGKTQVYLITAHETQHFVDASLQSLGLGRATPLAYYQATLQPNDTFLLAAQPSGHWSQELLSGLHGQGPESLRRRLFSPQFGDLNAVLVQARTGKGKFYVLPAKVSPPAEAPVEAPPAVASEAQISEQPAPLVEATVLETSPQPTVEEEIVQTQEQPEELAVLDEPTLAASPAVKTVVAPAVRPPLNGLSKALAKTGVLLLSVLRWLGQAGQAVLKKILPAGDPFQAVPNSMMAFIALAAPVIIVTLASTVYFRLGREAQFDVLFAQAQQMAARAAGQPDEMMRRADWEATLALLNQAEALKSTSETQALRAQGRNALDAVDLARRVDFLPAIINGLPPGVVVTRMIASDVDLYMLDGRGGVVYHAVQTARGYDLDLSFQCGSTEPGRQLTGTLIDILAWPASFRPAASVLAMDTSGNVMYCSSNDIPTVARLVPPPTALMDNLAGFTLQLGALYFLDPPANAVWVYPKGQISEQPLLYFDDEVPFMSDVIDMAVNANELYLLHSDGRMTFCTYSAFGVAPTRCQDLPYIDSRLGRENTPLLFSNPFTQLVLLEPPDPSLFLLEPITQAIYHFSLRTLIFQRQYLPLNPIAAQPATAFTINPVRRTIFLAVDNQVYYAYLP
jgi:hypothetical protein